MNRLKRLLDFALSRDVTFFRLAFLEFLCAVSRAWDALRGMNASRGLAFVLGAYFLWLALLLPSSASGFMEYNRGRIRSTFSGYAKTLNFFTHSTGFSPEMAENPLARGEKGESVFLTLERVRLKNDTVFKIDDDQTVAVKIHYDHQASLGSFVGTDDFRLMKKQVEDRQFLDLSQTFVEEEGGFYEHRFYRASVAYQGPWGSVEVGRQQIPWGVGHFFTPTDLFNPFNPTQIELDERDGVDAINLITERFDDFKLQTVYTPRGRRLHPQRYLARLSHDVKGYEVGVLGGRINQDHALGFDLAGNVKDSAVRGEFLYREADEESDFVKFTVNADYNFPHNIYGLLEYHFNGQGRRDFRSYENDRFVSGEIQQVAKNYLAGLLRHDLTPLIRLENRTIFNMDDVSFFVRPEIQYEIRSNLLLTGGMQLFLGGNQDELGAPNNLYLGELKYSF